MSTTTTSSKQPTLPRDLDVLIVGASGHLGSEICKYLCEKHKNEVKLSLLVPLESKQKVMQFEKCITGSIITFDVLNGNMPELVNKLKNFTVVVNCMNFFDTDEEFKAENNLIDCCCKAGVKFYIPSDFSLDFRNIKPMTNLPRIEVRKKIHDILNKSKLKWCSILCGVLIEKLLVEDCMLICKNTNTLSYYGTGNEEFEISTYLDVAKFVSELIVTRKFETCDSQFLSIYSEKITFKELGNWLKEMWGNIKMNCLGTMADLDKKLMQTSTDKVHFHYLQYLKVILMKESRIEQVDNQIWPSIQKCGAKEIVRQWTSHSSSIAL